jgi:hypothetical protein
MNWYYVKDGATQGPLAPELLMAEVNLGRVTPTTLVWREGSPQWLPFAKAEPELLALSSQGRCTECGKLHPLSELVSVKEFQVCSGCKEVFVHKLERGVPLGGGVGLWRRRKEVVVALNASFPDRCVKCNQPAEDKRLKRQLFWHHPALYVLIVFPGLLIYAIVAICVRKRATFLVGLCERHRSRRTRAMLIAWAVFVAGLGCFFFASTTSGETAAYAILAGVVAVLAAGITGAVVSRVVHAKKIDTSHAFVGGASPEFLASLPEWHEA